MHIPENHPLPSPNAGSQELLVWLWGLLGQKPNYQQMLVARRAIDYERLRRKPGKRKIMGERPSIPVRPDVPAANDIVVGIIEEVAPLLCGPLIIKF